MYLLIRKTCISFTKIISFRLYRSDCLGASNHSVRDSDSIKERETGKEGKAARHTTYTESITDAKVNIGEHW